MSKQKFYYLVAGLPDLVLERDVKNFDFKFLIKEIYEQIEEQDRQPIRDFLLPYDHQNINYLLHGRDASFNDKGYYSLDFLKENLDNPNIFPDYIIDFVQKVREKRERGDSEENYLNLLQYVWTQFYHQIAPKSKSKFIRSWFGFDQILRNIQTAWTCRKLGVPIEEHLIGTNDIGYFVKFNLPDLGLRKELLFGDQIFNLLDEDIDLLEREFRLDEIRWQMADELTTFNYFDMDKVLSILAKADIVDRWSKLDKERGAVLFDGFVKTLVEQKNIDI